MSDQGYPKLRNTIRGKEVDPAGGAQLHLVLRGDPCDQY